MHMREKNIHFLFPFDRSNRDYCETAKATPSVSCERTMMRKTGKTGQLLTAGVFPDRSVYKRLFVCLFIRLICFHSVDSSADSHHPVWACLALQHQIALIEPSSAHSSVFGAAALSLTIPSAPLVDEAFFSNIECHLESTARNSSPPEPTTRHGTQSIIGALITGFGLKTTIGQNNR